MKKIRHLIQAIFINPVFQLLFSLIFAQNFKYIKPRKFNEKDYKESQLIRGALVSLSIIAILQMSSVDSLSLLLKTSTFFFVFSIFSLGIAFVMEFYLVSISDKVQIPPINNWLNFLGILLTGIAIVLVIFHISTIIGIISILLFILGLCLLSIFYLLAFTFNFDELYEKLSTTGTQDEIPSLLKYRIQFRALKNIFTWMEDSRFKNISNNGGITDEEKAIIIVDLTNNDHMNILFQIWELKCQSKISENEYSSLKRIFITALRDNNFMQFLDDILKDEKMMKQKLSELEIEEKEGK